MKELSVPITRIADSLQATTVTIASTSPTVPLPPPPNATDALLSIAQAMNRIADELQRLKR